MHKGILLLVCSMQRHCVGSFQCTERHYYFSATCSGIVSFLCKTQNDSIDSLQKKLNFCCALRDSVVSN